MPVVTGTVVTFIFIPLNWLLMKPLGHGGLALATSIAAILHMVVLLEILRRRLGGIDGALVLRSFAKVAFSSAVAGGVAWCALRLVTGHVEITTALGALIGVSVAGGLGTLAYIGLVALLKVDEAGVVWSQIVSRFRGRKPPSPEVIDDGR